MVRALVVRQPWANLIACGLKSIEVRSWSTDFRGDIVICAAKAVDTCCHIEFDTEPRGSTICVVKVVDVRMLRRSDDRRAMFQRREWILNEGLYAWVLSKPRPLKPRPTKGQLKLFDVPSDIVIPA